MSEVEKILEYIGADKRSVNVGTKVKYDILTAVITLCMKVKDTPLNVLTSRLSLACNVTPRTMKEGYLEPLIDIGILKYKNNVVTYIGLTNITEPEKEISKEEMKKIEEEALK